MMTHTEIAARLSLLLERNSPPVLDRLATHDRTLATRILHDRIIDDIRDALDDELRQDPAAIAVRELNEGACGPELMIALNTMINAAYAD